METDENAMKKSITKVTMDRQKSSNNADIERFMKEYWNSDSFTFNGSYGFTKGCQNTLGNYRIRYPDKKAMGKLELEILKIDITSDNPANLVGKYTLYRQKNQQTGLFTLIWKKINNISVISEDHTC